jgi:hypothetical protein
VQRKKQLQIKAIPTFYSGIKFRSRIEARWALFYDEIGVQWEYEKEGFDLGKELGGYVPDFYIHDLDLWVEIKGGPPTLTELRKLESIATTRYQPTSVCLFYGPIPSFYVGIEVKETLDLSVVNGLALQHDRKVDNENSMVCLSNNKKGAWYPAYWGDCESGKCGYQVAFDPGHGGYPFCQHCWDTDNGPFCAEITPTIVAALHKARVWDFTHAGEAE